MNKIYNIRYIWAVLLSVLAFQLTSCQDDDEAPVIDCVWSNTTSEPTEKTTASYPGMVIALQGQNFSDLQKVSVNGVDIDLMKTIMYDTDNYITFAIPDQLVTTEETGLSEIRVTTAHGEAVYQPFLVKKTSEKPTIKSVSASKLHAGDVLEIKGINLDGASEVYLPLTFDKEVKCEWAESQESTATSLYVVVPEEVNFAKGRVRVVLNKHDEGIDLGYSETVTSSVINFSNN